MASITERLAQYARSPQGQRLVAKARGVAEKPENQRRIEQLRQRLAKKT